MTPAKLFDEDDDHLQPQLHINSAFAARLQVRAHILIPPHPPAPGAPALAVLLCPYHSWYLSHLTATVVRSTTSSARSCTVYGRGILLRQRNWRLR